MKPTLEDQLQHALDMVFKPGYAVAYYATIMHNEVAKYEGRPTLPFDPKNPGANLPVPELWPHPDAKS